MSEIDSGEKIKIGIKNEKAFVWLNEGELVFLVYFSVNVYVYV